MSRASCFSGDCHFAVPRDDFTDLITLFALLPEVVLNSRRIFVRTKITNVGLQERLADSGTQLINVPAEVKPGNLEEQLPGQRVTIRVQTNRRECKHDIAGPNLFAVDYLLTIDNANDKTCDVV